MPLFTLALVACGESSGDGDGTDTIISSGGITSTSSAETGDSSATTDGSAGTTDGSAGTTTDTSDSDTAASDTTGDTGDDPVPTCQIPCSSVADCVQAGTEGSAYDEDNYACSEGHCQYLGCNSDTECAALGNYVCDEGALGVPICVVACTTATDCDLGSGPAYDADNYSFDNGGCVYSGCNSDAECEGSVAGTVCTDFGSGVSVCASSCTTPEDCSAGQLAYDADNYDCVSGHCEYTGCNSDAECMEFSNLVCV
jgi:hypothetical protein